MTGRLAIVTALVAVLGVSGHASAALRSELIPEPTAARHGLSRAWFTQVQMDPATTRFRDVTLDSGTLFVQTDRAMLQAIDGETGQTLWAKQIGDPHYPTMPPGLSHELLVVLNGTRLYALDRHNGELLYQTKVRGVPGAGPAVSRSLAYVPTIAGAIIAYRLEPARVGTDESSKSKDAASAGASAAGSPSRHEAIRLEQEPKPPLVCQSWGHAYVQPLVTTQTQGKEYIIWPTDRGNLEMGQIDHQKDNVLSVKYELRTEGEIVARPAYAPPDPRILPHSGVIFAPSKDGFVYALVEKNCQTLWRFSAGNPIVESPALIDDRLYVTTQLGGMFCVAAQTGAEQWWAPDLLRFVAASKERIYARDKLGHLQILNAKTGTRLDDMPLGVGAHLVTNTETDRIYLLSDTGLVQCLREIELTSPLVHNQKQQQEAGIAEESPRPGQDRKAAAEAKPAGMQELPKGGDNPFVDGGAKEDNLRTPSKPATTGAAKGAAKAPAKKPPAKVLPGKGVLKKR